MRVRTISLAAAAVVVCGGSVRAQTVWDAPLLLAPGSPAGLGLFLSDPHASSGLGVFGVWRAAVAPRGIGLRAGVTEDFNDDLVAWAGADFSGAVTSASERFPIDVIWVAGLGASLGDVLVVSFPLGVSLGRVVRTESGTFNPYLSPRVVLDGYVNDEARQEDVSIDVAIDLGLDLSFHESWAVRFAATVGDRQSVAIGVHLGGGGA